VNVNLANGNVATSFAAPTVSTVGGPMGMSFNYNSQAGSNAGLTGTYYLGSATPGGTVNRAIPTSNPTVLQRTDPNVSFNWATTPPAPGLASTNFLATWKGILTAPSGATNVKFGFIGDDSAFVYINGSTTASASLTTPNASLTPTMSPTATTLNPGPNSILVEFEDGTDAAQIALYVTYTYGGSTVQPEVVPASWFTKTVQSLPNGWAGSQPIVGSQTGYVSAQNNGSSIVFTDVAGRSHSYTEAANGIGYTPPPGETGIVTVTSGAINLTDSDGTVYAFTNAGLLTSVTAATDAASAPAKPVLAYNALGQLTSLTDALSVGSSAVRQVLFTYATLANGSGSGACAPPSGTSSTLEAPPVGYLCEISYPDGSATQLYYDLNGQLAEEIEPGASVTNFGYTQQNSGPLAGSYLLTSIRNPLANDWLAYSGVTPSSAQNTTLAYDALGRAASVMLPAPDGQTAAQPTKDYSYSSTTGIQPVAGSTGTAWVDAVGENPASEADGHTRTVVFNSSLQKVSDESAMGLTTTQTWDAADDLLTSTDPQGVESTTVYDWQHRPTDSYGPAASTCFTGQVPNGSCALPPAHSSITYDGGAAHTGGLSGLNAEFFNSSTLTGAPKAFALGVGTSDGSVNQTWTTAPATGVSQTNFSAELTGTITLNRPGFRAVFFL